MRVGDLTTMLLDLVSVRVLAADFPVVDVIRVQWYEIRGERVTCQSEIWKHVAPNIWQVM